MTPRVFAPDMDALSANVCLPDDESAHLVRVLRLGEGDAVEAFNGRGVCRSGVIARAARHQVELTLGASCRSAPEPRVRVTLAQALLKGDKFDDVVRDATMLGVHAIQPLAAAFIDVPRAAVREGGRLDRWQRIAVGSAKQCGRGVVPGILPAVPLREALAADASGVRVLLGEPSVAGERTRVGPELARQVAEAGSVFVAVGPEGGWSPEEVRLAEDAGCLIVGLGRLTLRADAAPLVALSVLLYATGDL